MLISKGNTVVPVRNHAIHLVDDILLALYHLNFLLYHRGYRVKFHVKFAARGLVPLAGQPTKQSEVKKPASTMDITGDKDQAGNR